MLFLAEFVSGIGVMILDITFGSFAAALIPHRLRARVAGTTRTLNYGIRPIGALLGGALGSAIGVRTDALDRHRRRAAGRAVADRLADPAPARTARRRRPRGAWTRTHAARRRGGVGRCVARVSGQPAEPRTVSRLPSPSVSVATVST